MRLIKLAFISVIVFALLITFMSLFFPSHIRISKAVDINASKDSIQLLMSDPEKRKTGKDYLLSAFIVLLIGFPSCLLNSKLL